jgi:hypothetical protein
MAFMKRTPKKPLQLATQTIRSLDAVQLAAVDGAGIIVKTGAVKAGCTTVSCTTA